MWTLAERLTRLAVDQDFTSSILVRPPFKNVIHKITGGILWQEQAKTLEELSQLTNFSVYVVEKFQ